MHGKLLDGGLFVEGQLPAVEKTQFVLELCWRAESRAGRSFAPGGRRVWGQVLSSSSSGVRNGFVVVEHSRSRWKNYSRRWKRGGGDVLRSCGSVSVAKPVQSRDTGGEQRVWIDCLNIVWRKLQNCVLYGQFFPQRRAMRRVVEQGVLTGDCIE